MAAPLTVCVVNLGIGCGLSSEGREDPKPVPTDVSTTREAASTVPRFPLVLTPQETNGASSDDSVPPADQPATSLEDSSADHEAPVALLSLPNTVAEARQLWKLYGKRALPEIADFYHIVDLTGKELEPAFLFLRALAAEVPVGGACGADVVGAIRGFMRMNPNIFVKFSVDQSPVPTSALLQRIVGLRPSEELGPGLLQELREGWPEPGQNGTFEPCTSAFVQNAVHMLAFLAYREADSLVMRFARECIQWRNPSLAIELMRLTRDPAGVSLVTEYLSGSRDPRVVRRAASVLQLLGGNDVEFELAKLLHDEDPVFQALAVPPLFLIATPSALRRLFHVRDTAREQRLVQAVDIEIQRYAKVLKVSFVELDRLIRDDPVTAAQRLRPFVMRLTLLTGDDRRLTHDDLVACLEHWCEAGTIYSSEWTWVRDRHILAVAHAEDQSLLEAVRRAVLGGDRDSSLREAAVIQRVIVALQRSEG